MNLTPDEWRTLITTHGNACEVLTIRSRLHDAGLGFCSYCAGTRPVTQMRITTQCWSCSKQRRRRRLPYDIVESPERAARRQRRSRVKRHDQVIAEKRAYHASRNWSDGVDIAARNQAHRTRYQERLALGMSPAQAAYTEDWSAFAPAWAAYCESVRPRKLYPDRIQ